MPHKETTETFYKLSQIVRVNSSGTRQLFIMACLQENVSVGMNRVKAKVFIQDPFNPVLFTKDAERYVDVSNIVCALTCYEYREDTLELEEDDLILLLDVLHHTNEVVTVARQLSQLRWQKRQSMKYSMSRFQEEERGGLKAIFSTMNRRVKQANKYGKQW